VKERKRGENQKQQQRRGGGGEKKIPPSPAPKKVGLEQGVEKNNGPQEKKEKFPRYRGKRNNQGAPREKRPGRPSHGGNRATRRTVRKEATRYLKSWLRKDQGRALHCRFLRVATGEKLEKKSRPFTNQARKEGDHHQPGEGQHQKETCPMASERGRGSLP